MIEERCKVRGIILVCEVVVEMVLDMNRILTTKSDFKDRLKDTPKSFTRFALNHHNTDTKRGPWSFMPGSKL